MKTEKRSEIWSECDWAISLCLLDTLVSQMHGKKKHTLDTKHVLTQFGVCGVSNKAFLR